MGGLSSVFAALLGLILCHVACPVVVAANTLPERHPGLPRVDGAHYAPVWSVDWLRGSCNSGGSVFGVREVAQRREKSPLVVGVGERRRGMVRRRRVQRAVVGESGRGRGRAMLQMRVRQPVVLVCLWGRANQRVLLAGERIHLTMGLKWRWRGGE
jgi:hypothetical protein